MIDQSKAVNNWQTLCGFWQSDSSVSMYEYMEMWRYVWRYMAVWFICIKQQMFVWRYMVNELWFLSRFNLNRQPKVTGGKGCCMEISVFVSSEGALYVILPYDYQAHPLFEHTPVLNNNFEY